MGGVASGAAVMQTVKRTVKSSCTLGSSWLSSSRWVGTTCRTVHPFLHHARKRADLYSLSLLTSICTFAAVALQSQCNETAVHVLSGNAEATGALRMKASGKHMLMLGGVDCRLLRYDVLPKLPQQAAEKAMSQSKLRRQPDMFVR